MPKRRHTPLVLIVAVLLVPFIALRMCSRSRIAAPRPANPASYEPQGGRPMSFTLSLTRIPQRRSNRRALHLRWRRPLARARLVRSPRRSAVSRPHRRRSRRPCRRLDPLAPLEHSRPRHVPCRERAQGRTPRQRRAPGRQRLPPHRLWRPMSAAGPSPPLLLPALRPRRPPRPQARRQPRRIGTRHGAAHPRPDPVDGHLQALAIIDARRSQQQIHGRPSSTPSTRRPAIYYPARHLPGGKRRRPRPA